MSRPISGEQALAISKIETHYFMNNCFLPSDYIAKNVRYIQQLPCYIVQGRHDVICPPSNAYKLHKIWGKNSKLRFNQNIFYREIPSLSQISKNNLSELWYNNDDYERFKLELKWSKYYRI